jgi:exodeoxyribonuclease V alpha subunit
MSSMEMTETGHRLALFGIPPGASRDVRGILARLLVADSLSFGELQTARDIVGRCAEAVDDAVYVFLAAMFISQRAGNACLRAEKGVDLLVRGGHLENGDDEGVSNDDYAARVRAVWDSAVAATEKIAGDVIVKRAGPDGARWFFRRDLDAVEAVSAALSERARTAEGDERLSDAELAAAIGFDGFRLNDQQIEAVRKVVRNSFLVVTGGPGTGKTTVVCAMLRALMARGVALDEIALVAPTARAAQRVGEALRDQCARAAGLGAAVRRQIESLDGSTIHSLLGGFPPDWKYTRENRLPLRLVVVDESSMVDLHLMKALIAALPDACRLVLLGDKDQLPSVDTGAVLGDMVGRQDAPFVVRLTQSKRFSDEFAACARAVNAGDAQTFWKTTVQLRVTDTICPASVAGEATAGGCFCAVVPEKATAAVWRRGFVEWAARQGLLDDGRLVELSSDAGLKEDESLAKGILSAKTKEIFAELNRSRILTVVREGVFGVQGVNELLIQKRFGGRRPLNPLVKTGVPVMITRNAPARRLWNGDVGVTVEGRSGLTVIFPRGDQVVSCPVGLLPEHELAYAMTVHKSQGSEFDNVMVVLPDDHAHPLLNRQIVYTGITRAKKRALIVGTSAAVATALARKIERETGVRVCEGPAPL